MNSERKLLSLLLQLALVLYAFAEEEQGCVVQNSGGTTTYYGGSMWLEDAGQMRGYVTLQSRTMIPRVVGIQFKNGLITASPSLPIYDNTTCHEHACIRVQDIVVKFPNCASFWTPFTFAYITFNTLGHGPEGVYDVPHYDFHFFMTPFKTFETLTQVGPSPGLLDMDVHSLSLVDVPAKYLMPGAFRMGPPTYGMGQHWSSPDDPVFHGTSFNFTGSFAFGSYNGKVIYFEPLASLQLLATRPDQCWDIPMPQAFEKAGWYPTKYCLRNERSSDLQAMTLESFVYYPAA